MCVDVILHEWSPQMLSGEAAHSRTNVKLEFGDLGTLVVKECKAAFIFETDFAMEEGGDEGEMVMVRVRARSCNGDAFSSSPDSTSVFARCEFRVVRGAVLPGIAMARAMHSSSSHARARMAR